MGYIAYRDWPKSRFIWANMSGLFWNASIIKGCICKLIISIIRGCVCKLVISFFFCHPLLPCFRNRLVSYFIYIQTFDNPRLSNRFQSPSLCLFRVLLCSSGAVEVSADCIFRWEGDRDLDRSEEPCSCFVTCFLSIWFPFSVKSLSLNFVSSYGFVYSLL